MTSQASNASMVLATQGTPASEPAGKSYRIASPQILAFEMIVIRIKF
jgi:hypothetical protein